MNRGIKIISLLMAFALACLGACSSSDSNPNSLPSIGSGGQDDSGTRGGGANTGGSGGSGTENGGTQNPDQSGDLLPSESGIDATYKPQIIKAADYIVSIQNSDGAIPDAHDSGWFNNDNTMGYTITSLYFAYLESKDNRYRDAMKKALAWQASVQDSSGLWHIAYKKNSRGTYVPSTPPEYTRDSIDDIKSIDAIQSFFVYNLWLYSQIARDDDFARIKSESARMAIDALILNNRDENGRFFYSSWQLKRGNWRRLNYKYAMGQGDVFVGLIGAWHLLGDRKYFDYANTIRNSFDSAFWDPAHGRYANAIDENDAQDDEEYILAQAIPTFFFGKPLMHSSNALKYLISHKTASGYIDPENSDSSYTLNIAALALAANQLENAEEAASDKSYLASMQVNSTGRADGAFKDDASSANDDGTSNLYIDNTAFCIMALSGTTMPSVPTE